MIVELKLVCKECGEEFLHVKGVAGKSAEWYENWAKENVTVCPECEKRIHRERIAAHGITDFPDLAGTSRQVTWAEKIRLEVLDYILNSDDKMIFNDGVYRAYKDVLKHYRCTRKEADKMKTKVLQKYALEMEYDYDPKWNKKVILDDIASELLKVTSAEDWIEKYDSPVGAALRCFKKIMVDMDGDKNFAKPTPPDFINGKWNQKVYGTSGHYTIYLDNIKMELTDAQKMEVDEYLRVKREYERALK